MLRAQSFNRIVIKRLRTFILILSFALNVHLLCFSLISNCHSNGEQTLRCDRERGHTKQSDRESGYTKKSDRDEVGVWQVWFCHLFRFATVKSSIHNHGTANCCCCCWCSYSIQLHDRITYSIAHTWLMLFSLRCIFLHVCVCISLFFHVNSDVRSLFQYSLKFPENQDKRISVSLYLCEMPREIDFSAFAYLWWLCVRFSVTSKWIKCFE